MKKNKIVVANLKMNMDLAEVSNYLRVINKTINSKDVIICPTSIFIPYFLKHNYQVGIQNTYYNDFGAYTGEVSPLQAKSMGIDLTILGHSERRLHLNETNELINLKVIEALKHDLKVILCIGETAEEYAAKNTNDILKLQISKSLNNLDQEMLKKVIIAYEPIWAIGTNLTPTNSEIETTISSIKMMIKEQFNFDDMPVIYGGSVNDKNINELNTIKNIAGYLVGGASLSPDKFLKIIEVVVNQ